MTIEISLALSFARFFTISSSSSGVVGDKKNAAIYPVFKIKLKSLSQGLLFRVDDHVFAFSFLQL